MAITPDAEQRKRVEAVLDAWLERELAENPTVVGLEQGGPDEHLWIVRLAGEAKQHFAVRFVVDQRTLRAETYVLPIPTENRADTYGFVLRTNARLYGVAFEIGEENGLYLAGRLDLRWVDIDELDRLLGTLYSVTESTFVRLRQMIFN